MVVERYAKKDNVSVQQMLHRCQIIVLSEISLESFLTIRKPVQNMSLATHIDVIPRYLAGLGRPAVRAVLPYILAFKVANTEIRHLGAKRWTDISAT